MRAIGFPAGAEGGAWVNSRIAGPLPADHLQINNDDVAGYVIQPGFSGSPIFLADEDKVVGMLVRADPSKRAAHVVLAAELVMRYYFPEPVRGTSNWKLTYFRQAGLGSLLNDLVIAERNGLQDDQCSAIQEALGMVANELADWDRVAAWETPLHEDFEELVELYKQWNGHERGPNHEHHRNRSLRSIRRHRQKTAEKIRKAEPLLFQLALDDTIENMIGHLSALPARHSGTFPAIRRMVKEYRKRCQAQSSLPKARSRRATALHR